MQEKLQNFIQLLKHVAKNHGEDKTEYNQLDEQANKVHKKKDSLDELEADPSWWKGLKWKTTMTGRNRPHCCFQKSVVLTCYTNLVFQASIFGW